jgi:glycosyltransferase involved in cell wall biosynthesis/uncharacterized cupin superfamily protein
MPLDLLTVDSMKDRFQRIGYIGQVPLLSSAQCRLVLRHLENPRRPKAIGWHKGHAAADWVFWEIATRPRLLDLLRGLLGNEINLWGASIIRRQAGESHPWHCDIETSSEAGVFATVWIGIENTTQASSLKFIPGSHKYPRTVQEARHRLGIKRSEPNDTDILSLASEYFENPRVDMPPASDGDAIIFDGRIWHGSHNLSSLGRRTSLLLQYGASHMPVYRLDTKNFDWPFKFLKEPRPPVLSVLGKPNAEKNWLVTPPRPKLSELTIIVHQLQMPLSEAIDKGWQPYPIFVGHTSILSSISCHASVLGSGHSPHPPHSHLEEEVLIILDGEAELIIPISEMDADPRTVKMGAGSLIHYPAYQWHTLRNTSSQPVSYLMFKWRSSPWEVAASVGVQVHLAQHQPAANANKAFDPKLVFEGPTNFLNKLHVHLTDLAPGSGYKPHADAYDVALVVLEGEIELGDRTLHSGGIAFFPAGNVHGMKNSGKVPARYLVIEFHADGIRPTIPQAPHVQSKRANKVAFVTDHLYLPDRFGGRESSTHDLAMALSERGYEVTVIGRATAPGAESASWRQKFDRFKWRVPYRIIRSNNVVDATEELLRSNHCDCAVYQLDSLQQLVKQDPVFAHKRVIFFRDVSTVSQLDNFSFPCDTKFIANSDFTAEAVSESIGRRPLVLPPIVDAQRYRTETTAEFATFINPVRAKGLDLMLQIVGRCVDIPFLFVEAWPLSSIERAQLRTLVANLPNVILEPPRLDMRTVYGRTRVLLAPSVWKEGWGRVVSEAQLSGIPVIASRIGGLPEAVGKGGLLMDPEAPVGKWAETLRNLWDDTKAWGLYSDLALNHSEEHQMKKKLDEFIAFIM